jgi:predicted aconitase with swiveling domain
VGVVIVGRVLVEGRAEAPALVLGEPLSFWGGLDPATGRIVEVGHPQQGEVVTGRVLVMPSGRGSSSSATVLAEAIRLGTGPAGIVLRVPDGIVAIGALVAAELYGVAVPVVLLDGPAHRSLVDGALLRVDAPARSRPAAVIPGPSDP